MLKSWSFYCLSLDDLSSPWKLKKCLQVALLCIQENPADRPTILDVYTMLKSETAAISTFKRPAFSVKRDEDEESKCALKVKICSVNELKFSISQSWIKAGYWYVGSEFPISEINSALFTHLICAFANVDSSTDQLSIPFANEQYFLSFSGTIRGKSLSVTTLLSVWNGQNATGQSILGNKVNYSVLSSMFSDSSHRKSFIESSMKTARRYGFQGIDLFWLWPNGIDLNNMGRLLDEWRAAITSDARNSSEPELILTAAVRYIPNHETVSYPIESMKRNLDWAHVVAYDYFLPSMDNVTGTHAALYNPASNISTDFGINNWLSRGFPANKLVLGVPYHGYAWTLANPNDKAIGALAFGPAITIDGSMGECIH
ncbi:class V chitinase-like [Pistacia vera]|uniref:class V chitinase-like n=1 Tax=Pistacia vera TaxID=55513 RepID=UPI0012634E2C|nr:class V chitinase-like [Pistacia vera]